MRRNIDTARRISVTKTNVVVFAAIFFEKVMSGVVDFVKVLSASPRAARSG